MYPYPDIPKYNGNGETRALADELPSGDLRRTQSNTPNWIGNYLFYQPIGGGGRQDQGYTRRG